MPKRVAAEFIWLYGTHSSAQGKVNKSGVVC